KESRIIFFIRITHLTYSFLLSNNPRSSRYSVVSMATSISSFLGSLPIGTSDGLERICGILIGNHLVRIDKSHKTMQRDLRLKYDRNAETSEASEPTPRYSASDHNHINRILVHRNEVAAELHST